MEPQTCRHELHRTLRSMGFSQRSRTPKHDMARPMWVTGVGEPAVVTERLREVCERQGATALVLEGPGETNTGLPTFGAAQRLLDQVVPRLTNAQLSLVKRYEEALRFVAPELMGEASAPSPLDAHAVAFAIVRRISRESLQSATHIDAVARLLLEAVRLDGREQGWVLVVHEFDHLDRPSLRVLHRLLWLSEAEDRLTVVGLCVGDPLGPVQAVGGVLRPRIVGARARLFRTLADQLAPDIFGDAAAGQAPVAPLQRLPETIDYTLRIAERLVQQNYEQAYLFAEQAIDGGRGRPEDLADLYRLVGLVDANIGEYDAADQAFLAATGFAEQATLRAHLHYLRALLLTKRKYDLEEAARTYRAGLEALDDAGENEDEGQVAFERAWLVNGLAFVTALRARSLDGTRRRQSLEQAIREEVGAYNMVEGGRQPHLVYLRHNLLANIAFLLEMLHRYEEAIQFWERAFGQYLGQGPAARRFEPIYLYRVGLLAARCGRAGHALTSLRRARDAASDLGERFLAERILYGLGYCALEAGRVDVARRAFEDGLAAAWSLRDWPACGAQGAGVHEAARRGGDDMRADEVRRWMAASQAPSLRQAAAELGTGRAHLVPPSPKLPAYLPGIDLEPAPEVNLNQYLVGAAQRFPGPAVPAVQREEVPALAGGARKGAD